MTDTRSDSAQKAATKPEERLNNAGSLLNWLLQKYSLRCDADLARHLCIEPSTISRIRNGKKSLGAGNLVQIHEMTKVSIKELRALMIEQPMKLNARMVDKLARQHREAAE